MIFRLPWENDCKVLSRALTKAFRKKYLRDFLDNSKHQQIVVPIGMDLLEFAYALHDYVLPTISDVIEPQKGSTLSEQIAQELESMFLIPDRLEEIKEWVIRMRILGVTFGKKRKRKEEYVSKPILTIQEAVRKLVKTSQVRGKKVASRVDIIIPYVPPLDQEEIYHAVNQIKHAAGIKIHLLIIDNQRRDFLRGNWHDVCSIRMDTVAEDMLKMFSPKKIDKRLLTSLLVDSQLSPYGLKEECEKRT